MSTRQNQPELMFCKMTPRQLTPFHLGRSDTVAGCFNAERYETGTEDGEYYCRGRMTEFAKKLISWPQAKVYYER